MFITSTPLSNPKVRLKERKIRRREAAFALPAMGDQILQARDVSRGDGLDGGCIVDRAAVGPVQPKPFVADAAGNVDEMRPSGVGARGRPAILRGQPERFL